MEIKDEMELYILNRALMLARFLHNDYDNKDFYGSPFTGAIHKKIIDELKTKFSNEVKYYPNESDLSIDGYPNYIEVIKKHISNIDNWSELSQEMKVSVIHAFIFPFTLSENIIDELSKVRVP